MLTTRTHLFALLLALLSLLTAASSSRSTQYFPRFHTRPRTNWVNDPNGPVYWNGVYHLFAQYNPHGAVWGDMSWCHMVSYDLVFWVEQPVALFNDRWYDLGGAFSGSATILNDGTVAISYTCVSQDLAERQCVAFPKDNTDKYLQQWVKYEGNPVISAPPPNGTLLQFRDVTSAWTVNGEYYMALVAQVNNGGQVVDTVWTYKSKDFRKWTALAQPMFQDPQWQAMWECPDFFPLTDMDNATDQSVWALKISCQARDMYRIGKYDSTRNTFTPFDDNPLYQNLDAGRIYASKRFYDPVGHRHILWGWVWEEFAAVDNGMTWQGLQTLPRVLSYDPINQMINSQPLPELAALRMQDLAYSSTASIAANSIFPASDKSWTSAQFEVILEADPSKCVSCAFGLNLLASSTGSEGTSVTVYINSTMSRLIDQSISVTTGTQYAAIPLDPNQSVAAQIYACEEMCFISDACTSWVYQPVPSRHSVAHRPDLWEAEDEDVGLPPNKKAALSFNSTSAKPKPQCLLSNGSLDPTAFIASTPTPGCVSALKIHTPYPVVVVDRFKSGIGQTAAWLAVAAIASDGKVRVNTYIDHSIIETFVNNATAITARVYPNSPASTSWNIFYRSDYDTPLPFTVSAWPLLDAVVG